MKRSRLFMGYLQVKRKDILVFLLFCGVFTVVFALFKLPWMPVIYASVICIALGILFLEIGFKRYYKKYQSLKGLTQEITITCENLPFTRELIEREYQSLIQSLFDENQSVTNKMSEKYTDLVDYYTIWVHQIKTPIAVMYLKLQGDDSDKGLLDELQRIEQYVEMVLTYLRLDAGTTDYVIKEYDLDTLLKQVIRKYASLFIRKKIKLEYQPLSVNVLTDEKWLFFVLEQVLTNALKYTKKGTISITIEEPKILCISDTGMGIAKEDLPRVFQKGFTGYNGRSDKKASGIGLYLCRRICENLGHKIWAESEIDAGTSIRIDLESVQLEVE